jgi:hypothetical protein
MSHRLPLPDVRAPAGQLVNLGMAKETTGIDLTLRTDLSATSLLA